LGPRLPVFFSECLHENKLLLPFCLVSAGAAVLMTCLLTLRQRREIAAAPITLQRLYYLRATWFAPAFGLTSFWSLLCPRGFALLKMVQVQFEGINIAVFGAILFLLLAEESYQHYKGSDTHDEGIGKKIIGALASQGPKPHFGVPPFGCCFRRWIQPHNLTPRHLILARNLFRQYIFVIMISSACVAWAAISLPTARFVTIRTISNTVQKLSSFLAIYGLMILYMATHDLMHDKWRTTSKFVAIKLVVLLCNFQDMFVGSIVQHVRVLDFECLGTDAHSEHFWNMYLTSLESILVAFLVRRAFPASEIEPFAGDFHLELVEMELEALQREAAADGTKGSSKAGAEAVSSRPSEGGGDGDGDGDGVELTETRAERAG